MGVSVSKESFTVTEASLSSNYQQKMSLWKVMTVPMSQVARQEAAQVGKFVWGNEGFKWVGEVKKSSTQSSSSPVDVSVSEAEAVQSFEASSHSQQQSHSFNR